nr:hypothetical protein [Leekyejoonella antrihumi]
MLTVKATEPCEERRVRCIDGRRACPPEDCGGVWGYAEILELLGGPAAELDEEAQDRLEWLGDGFDPEQFDAAEVDRRLEHWEAGGVGHLETPLPTTLLPLIAGSTTLPAGLMDLIQAARLGEETLEQSADLAARLARPWVVLLHEIGSGLKLTGAGYLPPASVKRIFDELDFGAAWLGTGNREDKTLPVAQLRRTAIALSLIRKERGSLRPTATGRKLAGDPDALITDGDPLALLRHIERRLPLDTSQIGEQAALLLLLTTATGARPDNGLDPAADLLTGLGWRTDDDRPVFPLAVSDEADLTYAVLDQLHRAAGGTDDADAHTTPDVVRDIARRALHGDGSMTAPADPGDPAYLADIDPQEAVAVAATSLIAEIKGVRNPLEAELMLSTALAAMDMGAPDDIDEQQLLDTLTFMLGEVIGYAESLGSQEALALLRGASVIGPEASRGAARASAERLAGGGVPDRPWAARVGRPQLLRAWRYGDIFGQQESVGVLFDDRGREHAVMVLIDHVLGGGVKDCWVAEGKLVKRLQKDVGRLRAGTDETFFEDLDAAKAVEVLEAALAQPPCPADAEQVEDLGLHLPLLRARTDHLRELAAGAR